MIELPYGVINIFCCHSAVSIIKNTSTARPGAITQPVISQTNLAVIIYSVSRRYQAEFLIHEKVPLNCIRAIVVYNESCATFVKKKLALTGLIIQVYIKRSFYFNR